MLKKIISLFHSCLLVLLFVSAFGHSAHAMPDLSKVGVYPAEGGALISVEHGRITSQLGDARAKRLAREQALRKAKYQLARHIYKDKLQVGQQYSVHVQGARVVKEEQQGNVYTLALLAHPNDVQLVARSPLEDFQEVNVSPLLDELLTKQPLLAEGGGNVFTVDEGWVGLGVGYAALPDVPDAASTSKARTIARVAAAEALSAFIFGIQVDTNSVQQELYMNSAEGEKFKEFVKSSSREEISGMLTQAQVAGEWFTTDSHIGVAVMVANHTLDLAVDIEQDVTEDAEKTPALYKSTIDEAWQKTIASRPWVHTGGATLCKHEDKLYVLTVVSGNLKGNATFDKIQLPTIMDAKARSSITGFLMGISNNSVTYSEEITRTELDKTEVSEHLQKVSKQGAAGVVRQIKKLGDWYSQDEKTIFQAFVVAMP